MQCNLKSPNSHFLQHLSWGSLSTIHYILLGRNETIVKTGAWNLSTSDKKSSTIRRIEQRSNNPTQHKVANHQQLLFFEQVRIVKFNQGTFTNPEEAHRNCRSLRCPRSKSAVRAVRYLKLQLQIIRQLNERSTCLIMLLAPSEMGSSLQHQPPLRRSRNRAANH